MSFFDLSGIILKSSFKKAATRKYPFTKKVFFPASRGSIRIDIQTCIHCSICAKKCPTKAIAVVKEQKTWTIDRLKCIACNYCVDVCPKKCLFNENQYSPASTSQNIETFTQV